MPPLFRFRDIAFGLLFLVQLPTLFVFPSSHPMGLALRVVYCWLLFLAVRHYWVYRRRVGPEVRRHRAAQVQQQARQRQLQEQQQAAELHRQDQQQVSQNLLAALFLDLGDLYTFVLIGDGGVWVKAPAGKIYHVYELDSQQFVLGSDAGSARRRAELARRERATIIYVDEQGGPAIVRDHEVWIHTGTVGLAEQVNFWEAAATQEAAARQRGVVVEADAVGQLDAAFPGWRIQKGLLMQRGGDIDALLTRPDGRLFSIDVKSHRGVPSLVEGVLHLGRAEKSSVQRQLQLQVQETGGQGVCWQSESDYGVLRLDGLLFVGGDVAQLREALLGVR